MSQFGYFSDPSQQQPAHDPGTTIPCSVCGVPLDRQPIKCVSFYAPGSLRSWFYRIHKSCATPEAETAIESLIVDAEYGAGIAG